MDGVAGGEIAVYEAGNGETRLEVRLEQDTVWLDQEQLAQLFGRDKSVIGKHLRAVYREGELDREATAADFAQVRSEGARTITRQIERRHFRHLRPSIARAGSAARAALLVAS